MRRQTNYNYWVKRSYVDFWRYGLVFKLIYDLKYVYFDVYIFLSYFHLLDFCEHILYSILYTICIVYCMYTVRYVILYAHGVLYCMHMVQYTVCIHIRSIHKSRRGLYRLIHIFLIWLEILPYCYLYILIYIFNMAGNPAISKVLYCTLLIQIHILYV